MNFRHLILLLSFLLLSACGDSDSDSDSGPRENLSITGSISKGPISGAIITAYTDERKELGQATSDSNGRYIITTTNNTYNGIVIIESSGGSYTDEATSNANVPAPNLSLARRVNGETEMVISITPLTEIAYHLANQDGDLNDIDNFNTIVAEQFGLGDIDITSVFPANLSRITAPNNAEGYYGTVLAILSQLQQDETNLRNAFEVIQAIKADMGANDGALVNKLTAIRSAANNANLNLNIKTDGTITDSILTSMGANPIEVISVFLEQTATLEVGDFRQLNAKLIPANTSNDSIVWESSNTEIVNVGSEGGLVKGLKEGDATVTVTTANDKTASIIITVRASASDSDKTAPTIQASHQDIEALSSDTISSSTDFSSLFTDDRTAVANMEYKVANFSSIAVGFGLTIGLDVSNSAFYKKGSTRPGGNKITVNPDDGFFGTAIIALTARDEAGNESNDLQFLLTVTAAGIVLEPVLQNHADILVIKNRAFSPIVFSNSGGGNISSCSSDTSLNSGLNLEVTPNKQSCQMSGETSNNFENKYRITAINSSGTSSAEITIISEASNEDADNDGLTNEEELNNGLDPLNENDADANNDGDSLSNKEEIHLGMDLTVAGDDVGGSSNADRFIFLVANRLSYGVHDSLVQDIKTQGVEAWINGQLDNPNNQLTNDVSQVKRDNVRQNFTSDLLGANIVAAARAVHSNFPLQNVMGDFWDNHFSTLFSAAGIGPHVLFDQDYFYLNSLGNFGQLLEYSAKSRSMSQYLNGSTSTKDKANENYAREVMELHTLGIHPNGFQAYDATAIKAASKIFTGWRYSNTGTTSRYKWYSPNFSDIDAIPTLRAISTFNFSATNHNDGLNDYDGDNIIDGDKIFSLKNLDGSPVEYTIASRAGSSGVEEGEEFLKLLSEHPSTAKYICLKLARKFVSDNPSESTVENCSQVFLQNKDSDTQIAQVLKNIFNSSEFNIATALSNKIKDDQEFIISLYRLLELDATDGIIGTGRSRIRTAGQQLFSRSEQLFFNNGAPTGYPESFESWNDTMVQSNRKQAVNTIISSDWSRLLTTYFNEKGVSNAAGVVHFIIPIITAGNYQQNHLKLAHDILYKDGTQFNMQEDRLRLLLSVFSQLPAFHLQ